MLWMDNLTSRNPGGWSEAPAYSWLVPQVCTPREGHMIEWSPVRPRIEEMYFRYPREAGD